MPHPAKSAIYSGNSLHNFVSCKCMEGSILSVEAVHDSIFRVYINIYERYEYEFSQKHRSIMVTLKPLSLGLLLLQYVTCVHSKRDSAAAVETIVDNTAVVEAKQHNTALMGKIFPELFKRHKIEQGIAQVFKDVTDLIHEGEVAVFALVGWGLVPLTESLYDVYLAKKSVKSEDGDDMGAEADYETTTQSKSSSSTIGDVKDKNTIHPFRRTRLFYIVDHISQASKIALGVIAVDVLALLSRKMGYNPWGIMEKISQIFSKIVYTGWFTYRIKLFKRHLLDKRFYGDLGKMHVFDQLGDGILYATFVVSMLNYLHVQTGLALTSLFSVGATGTLVFGLASKDIASQLLSGLTLHLSEKLFEGDDVRFHDGTSGRIVSMGWFETMVRNSDEIVVGVPNTEVRRCKVCHYLLSSYGLWLNHFPFLSCFQLSGQRVYNLSRTPKSQVLQTLRVSYDDADKISTFLEAIKTEVKKLPKIITDGSRPFRAHWRNYEDDYLEVVVDFHFDIKPTGNEYHDNRQQVLEAIFQAATKTGIKFQTSEH